MDSFHDRLADLNRADHTAGDVARRLMGPITADEFALASGGIRLIRSGGLRRAGRQSSQQSRTPTAADRERLDAAEAKRRRRAAKRRGEQ